MARLLRGWRPAAQPEKPDDKAEAGHRYQDESHDHDDAGQQRGHARSVGRAEASLQAPRRGRAGAGAPRGGASVRYMTARSLVLKLTAGKEEPERCNQALTVAATAVASGVPVSLWLTGEASWFALPDGCPDLQLPHATPLPELFQAVLRMGAVTLCTQCAARRDIAADAVVDGVRIAGAATFVAEALAEGAQALVY
jgi:predicted peroxiredoxin